MAHQHSSGHEGHQHDDDEEIDDLQECIEACLNCHAACTMTAQHCLSEGGEKSEINVVGVLLDCAEISQASANFMLRGSPYHGLTCGACAEVCRACEEACRAFPEDEQLAEAADACAQCAEACEKMVEMMAAEDDEEE